jgi:dihydrofolate reductase
MSKICAHEFMSLDGVFENPAWTAPYGFPPAVAETIGAITGASSAILLGRRTYEMFAPAWSTRTVEQDPGAPFFNDTPKYVVSSTLAAADDWQNSRVLGAYDPGAVRRLKARATGNVFVSGSGTLVRALLADRLLDELHLFVFPLVLGAGARLFPEGTDRLPLDLVGTQTFENGVVHLTYAPAS